MHPIYQNQGHKAEPEDIFPWTKIQHTNSRDASGEWTSACRIHRHKKCNGISYGSRTGGLFEKCQKATSTRMALADMDHQQPPTPVATENASANSIVNGTAKQKVLEE